MLFNFCNMLRAFINPSGVSRCRQRATGVRWSQQLSKTSPQGWIWVLRNASKTSTCHWSIKYQLLHLWRLPYLCLHVCVCAAQREVGVKQGICTAECAQMPHTVYITLLTSNRAKLGDLWPVSSKGMKGLKQWCSLFPVREQLGL